jgi:hypothetical protein
MDDRSAAWQEYLLVSAVMIAATAFVVGCLIKACL